MNEKEGLILNTIIRGIEERPMSEEIKESMGMLHNVVVDEMAEVSNV